MTATSTYAPALTFWPGAVILTEPTDSGAGNGAVFKVTTTGQETVLYSFTGGTDGGFPHDVLVLDSSGNLYGTAPRGGTVFKVDPQGNETTLYSFGGWGPQASLVRDSAGNMYSTTLNGGSHGRGTVFKITSGGKVTILHNFEGGPKGGGEPFSGVALDTEGNLYGAAGVIYKISLIELTATHGRPRRARLRDHHHGRDRRPGCHITVHPSSLRRLAQGSAGRYTSPELWNDLRPATGHPR